MQATHPPGGDDRGAISLIAVFFAVFAIAMLYSLIGTAQAIAFREGLQDHADKAALSSAILHARSMNLIVLINLVMAGLLAILVALKLVEGLAILGIIVAAGLAWITGGSTLAAIPPLKSVRDSVSSLYDSTKDPVYEALTALHDMASTVRDVAPMVAAAAALSNEDANGLHGFAASTRTTEGLPVVDDSFDYLCAKSGGIIDDLWTAPLTNAGVPIDTLGLGDVVEGMTGTLSEWFCGDSSGGPPSYPHTRTKGYPSTADDEECQASEAVSGEGEAAVSDACTRASRYQAAADPDGTTGACRTGEDCSVTGPYETNAARAREQCSPEGTPRPSQYVYQQRHGTVDYEWDGEAWRLLDRRYDTPRLMGTKKHGLPLPCGPKELNPRVAVGYNKIVRQSSDVSELIPVCSTESLPLTLPGHTPRKGDRMTVEFEEVTHILGCVVQIKESVELGSGESGGDGGDEKSPKKMREGIKLGDEIFQIRSFVQRDAGALDASRAVRLALWDRPSPGDPLSALRQFSDVGFAQAEYFYDGKVGEEWMWNMKWRARLVRFHLPDDGNDLAILAGLCAETDTGCDGLLPTLKQLEAVIAH